MAEITAVKYRAFLSYSHRDTAWSKWLHGALEGYRIDKDLIGQRTPAGVVPKTLRPIFRDREDSSAGRSLAERTLATLEASDFLIVVCSPHAAQSKYVNEEIRCFKAMGRAERVIPVIVDGEPGHPELDCFPPALRFKVAPDGTLTEQREEPIAADARPEGDGKDIAKLKVVAGLLGVRLDEIVRRAKRAHRHHKRVLTGIAGLFLVLTVIASGASYLFYKKLIESQELLDAFIEAAYRNVTKATSTLERYVPLQITLELLKGAEATFDDLLEKGKGTPKLRHRRALMLISFAESYLTLGQSELSLRSAEQASSLLEALVKDEPSNLAWKHGLLLAYRKIGDALDKQGFLTLARDRYRSSLDIAMGLTAADRNDPKNEEWQHDLSIAYNKIGDVQRQLGDLTDALTNYRKSLEIRGLLADSHPNNMRWQRDLASAYDRVGDVLTSSPPDAGNSVEALSHYKESLYIIQRFVRLYEEGLDWQRNLAVVYDKIANIDRAQGKPDVALASYIKSRDIREQLVAKDAKNIDWQRDLARSHRNIGNVLADLRKFDEAEKTHRRGIEIMERLSNSDPKNADWQLELAGAYDNIGDMWRAMTQPDGFNIASVERSNDVLPTHSTLAQALNNYRLSLDIRLRLAQADPRNLLWQYDLGVRHGHIGDVLMMQRDFASAMESYGAAQTIFRLLVDSDPKNAAWRHDLSLTYDRIGDILFEQDRLADALANYRESLAIAESLIAVDPNNVQWQVELVSRHWRLATSGDDAGRRWAIIVEILQRLKAANKLPTEQTSWLSEAEAQLAELQGK